MSIKNLNRRQRKKLHLGEFQQLCFGITAKLAKPLDAAARDALIDAFLLEAVEARGLIFGGGLQDGLDGVLLSENRYGSPSEEDRAAVVQWLEARAEFGSVESTPLRDAWY